MTASEKTSTQSISSQGDGYGFFLFIVSVSYTLDLELSIRACMKQPEFWQNNSRILHHDNAPGHQSYVVCQFFAKNEMTVLSYPHSPDLYRCDIFLFDKQKDSLWGTHFGDVEAVKAESTCLLNAIPDSDWGKCLVSWKKECTSTLKCGGGGGNF